jgi:general secretion pathway protein B
VIAAPLQKLSDLPEDLRRQVPTLSFGGSVYSALPAQRMVIFNGQVLREGDLVTDGLSVEEIRAKSAVLRLRGQRFEVVF